MVHRPAFRTTALSAVAALALTCGGLPALASTPAPASTASPQQYDGTLDVLFVGAHPDDEAGGLSTYGQWRENSDISTGVVTITRGEGGGNAVGPEEGPALGLLREGEERRAVGKAGITDVHNLDETDFYYTVSQPLTRQIWGHRDTLEKLVRVIRQTRPKVVVTMNPAPSPGNHGNHQEAARLAIEAYAMAGDPKRFPGQISQQGLRPWQPLRLFTSGATGSGPKGPECEKTYTPADPSADVFGIWSGRRSTASGSDGKTWALIEREGQREYASQGWAGFPDPPSDPAQLDCDRFTQVDSRVPYGLGGSPGAATPEAMLQGALVPAPGGLRLGTRFWLDSPRSVLPGESFTVTAHTSLRDARTRLEAPAGWKVTGTGPEFTVTPPADARPGDRVRLVGTLTKDRRAGTTAEAVEVRAPVRATPQLLPQVAEYEKWTADVGVPQLSGRVLPVLSLGSGASREVRVDLTNASDTAQQGTVDLALPEGFAADTGSKAYGPIEPGGSGSVTFTVTNTDPSLPTSNQGGTNGDYAYTVTTTSSGATDTRNAALELVPVTTIPQAGSAPRVDGEETSGEYGDAVPLDLSRRWEGEECTSKEDCSASAKVVRYDDALYLVVHVTDDTLGTVLEPSDCKRHWRTDSVEIALDPRGTSENTSSTFKTGIFPATTDKSGAIGGPCFERDADNHQGPGAETAPGMEVASKLDGSTPDTYAGYTIETKIDLADLPAAVDPERLGLNAFVYDSDTQDKTGQTRIGWSTWGGVQGDPYRWGLATLPGYTPPPDRPTDPIDPVVPLEHASSIQSPQSILQAAATRIPVAGGTEAPANGTARLLGPVRLSGGKVRGTLVATGAGTAHLFVWKGRTLGSVDMAFERAGVRTFAIDAPDAAGAVVAMGFASKAGGTASRFKRVE